MSAVFRNIETASYAGIVPPPSFGRPQKLEWLSLKSLVIDPEYQREITPVGRKNVRRIAESFNWSMFAPIIVAAIGDNRYAIVDGQHRATAAALVGIDRVPCAIIEAKRGEQAAAFRAINGNTTRLHAIHLFNAAVAAGDADALAVLDVCKRGGISILRNIRPLKDRETHAVKTISTAIARFGPDTAVLGLRAIVHSGDGRAEELNKTIIWGVIETLHDHPEWRSSEARLLAGFELVNLEELWRAAAGAAARIRGSSTKLQFASRLTAVLAPHFARHPPNKINKGERP